MHRTKCISHPVNPKQRHDAPQSCRSTSLRVISLSVIPGMKWSINKLKPSLDTSRLQWSLRATSWGAGALVSCVCLSSPVGGSLSRASFLIWIVFCPWNTSPFRRCSALHQHVFVSESCCEWQLKSCTEGRVKEGYRRQMKEEAQMMSALECKSYFCQSLTFLSPSEYT